MKNNIKNDTQQLIKNFNEATAGDNTKAMVVMSTGIEEGDVNLLLACAGTGSMLLNVQASSIVETFSHLIKNGTIEQPELAAVELLANLNKDLLLAASEVNHGKN